MASAPLVVVVGGGGVGGEGTREKQRWVKNKVYTRKAYRTTSKWNPSSQPPPQQTVGSAGNDVNSSVLQSRPAPNHCEQSGPRSNSTAASEDDASTLKNHRNDGEGGHHPAGPVNHVGKQGFWVDKRENGHRPLISRKVDDSGQSHIIINFASGTKHEAKGLRMRLADELEQIRALFRKLEDRQLQLPSFPAPALPPLSPPAPLPVTAPAPAHAPASFLVPASVSPLNAAPLPVPMNLNNRTKPQFSAIGARSFMTVKKPFINSQSASAGSLHLLLSVSVPTGQMEKSSMSEPMEKEKRTPKANQYYRNSEFLLAKDKFPPTDSHRKTKSNGSKKQADYVSSGVARLYAQGFKSCTSLLSRLMKHKHGWVFNTPVDVEGLGLHDYYIVITNPMDLGTVKFRLNSKFYKSPREFAEDVRLTFRNAMTYNPKGQDVHIMAEQLLTIFEERWPAIEAELTMPYYPVVTKKASPSPLDVRRILARSDSTAHHVFPDSAPKALSYTPQSVRTPALKKPKAKDLDKRDMTFEEKQKLSLNLQNLPSEKLDIIVQIIKRRNSSLSQHADEIEVDIDSVDTETLWELDRFVTNYKKSLSKYKRKAELVLQARQHAERSAQNRNPEPIAAEVPKENKIDNKLVDHSSPVGEKTKGNNSSASSSSCSSSSDTSSSSDSDSESSLS